MSDTVAAMLLPAGILIGLAFGWLLGRASVKDVLAGSRALRGMLRQALDHNRELTRKLRDMSNWIAKHSQRAAAAVASPPSRSDDDADPLPESPRRASVVLDGNHRRDVLRRRAESEFSDNTLYPASAGGDE